MSYASISVRAHHRLSSLSRRVVRHYQRPDSPAWLERAGVVADLGIKVHAHMLRHSTGYKLANDGHDTRSIQSYMGHRSIQNITRYTSLALRPVEI